MSVLPVFIAALVLVDVSLWTFRVAVMNRGDKRLGAALGAIQAVVSVTAIGQVVTNLDNPLNIAGYAIGVGAGTYLGVLADERLNRRAPIADGRPTTALEEPA
jgi:uncharacterized protein YebE (UPF0316 family)